MSWKGGEYPFDLITAELEQFDKNKGAWVKIWTQSVDPAPRGRDVEYEFFETIPTKWKPDPTTPDWVKPEVTYPGDNWNGKVTRILVAATFCPILQSQFMIGAQPISIHLMKRVMWVNRFSRFITEVEKPRLIHMNSP